MKETRMPPTYAGNLVVNSDNTNFFHIIFYFMHLTPIVTLSMGNVLAIK